MSIKQRQHGPVAGYLVPAGGVWQIEAHDVQEVFPSEDAAVEEVHRRFKSLPDDLRAIGTDKGKARGQRVDEHLVPPPELRLATAFMLRVSVAGTSPSGQHVVCIFDQTEKLSEQVDEFFILN